MRRFAVAVLFALALQTPAFKERLQAQGIAVRKLEEIAPSMEDVFVALIEAEERKVA